MTGFIRNERMRALRQERGWTQQEAADAVADAVCAATKRGRPTGIDAQWISRLERGETRWPNADYRAALRTVYRAATDAELGLSGIRERTTSRAPTLPDQVDGEPVERRNFIGLGAGMATAGMSTALDLLAALRPATAPTVVRAVDVEQVRQAAQLFTSWDHTYGGAIVREAVIAQLRWSAMLLKANCPPSLRNDLLSAVGYLSGVSGFMAFDAFAHAEAKQMFVYGLACAEEAGQWHLRAKLLSHMARQAIWCNDPDTGLTYAELALVRADRLTATERAMLHTARARALGKLGHVQETLRAVGTADDAFAQAAPHDDPPWMAYYDHAQHHGDTGHALFDLAMNGHFETKAAERLRIAVDEHSDAYARSRAISGTKLATLTMQTGDPIEAVAIGTRALNDAGRLRSQRAVSDLIELRQTAERYARTVPVAELTQRISAQVSDQ